MKEKFIKLVKLKVEYLLLTEMDKYVEDHYHYSVFDFELNYIEINDERLMDKYINQYKYLIRMYKYKEINGG